ncbi:MAG: AsnC family transcriptional regulator [Rhodothalassiaceae bacterium]|nr:MAG: AsnC family transcriptional regulator [Rhodothalassiaceae bacterium]
MQTLFVMIKCELGATYRVAEALVDAFEEIRSVHSISGEYDLLARFDLDDEVDMGRFVTERVQPLAGIRDTFTLVALDAFPLKGG